MLRDDIEISDLLMRPSHREFPPDAVADEDIVPSRSS